MPENVDRSPVAVHTTRQPARHWAYHFTPPADARVIREGPTTTDVYIGIRPFYGMAPATVSGYRLGGRCYA